MIEKIGRGTIKMIEDCEAKGYAKPTWQSKSGVTIPPVFPDISPILIQILDAALLGTNGLELAKNCNPNFCILSPR